jgi:hypothetical protein
MIDSPVANRPIQIGKLGLERAREPIVVWFIAMSIFRVDRFLADRPIGKRVTRPDVPDHPILQPESRL